MICPVCKHDVQPKRVLGGAPTGVDNIMTGFGTDFHSKCPRPECGATISDAFESKIVSSSVDEEIAYWERELATLRHATQLTVEQAHARAHGEIMLARLKATKERQENPPLAFEAPQVPPVRVQSVVVPKEIALPTEEDDFVADLKRQLAGAEKQVRRLRAMIAAAETV